MDLNALDPRGWQRAWRATAAVALAVPLSLAEPDFASANATPAKARDYPETAAPVEDAGAAPEMLA